MFLEPEDTSIVKANALENSVAVKQTMIEDRNLRVSFGIKLPINVNLRVLDARRGGPRATFNRGFNYCLGSRLVSFRLVQHQRVSRFHNRNKYVRRFTK